MAQAAQPAATGSAGRARKPGHRRCRRPVAVRLRQPAPGADLAPLVLFFVVVVIVAGSLLTYLWVELPTGASGVRRRSAWAGILGLFAAVPIAYLVLVVVFQVLLPGDSVMALDVRSCGGGVAQWLEQTAYIRPVPGSNPGSPTIPPDDGRTTKRACPRAGRASARGPDRAQPLDPRQPGARLRGASGLRLGRRMAGEVWFRRRDRRRWAGNGLRSA